MHTTVLPSVYELNSFHRPLIRLELIKRKSASHYFPHYKVQLVLEVEHFFPKIQISPSYNT
jgi:hypothetical protein